MRQFVSQFISLSFCWHIDRSEWRNFVLTARRHLSKSRQLVFRSLRGKRILLCRYRSPWGPGMRGDLEEQDYNYTDLIQALRHSAAGIGEMSRLLSNYMSVSKAQPANSLTTPPLELNAQSCRITLSTSRLLQHAAHAIQHPDLATT